MVIGMKTTVEISDSLLAEARSLAAKEQTTVRALIEEGLRRIVADRRSGAPFRLRRATFGGQGIRPELATASWDAVRDLIYEDHGA